MPHRNPPPQAWLGPALLIGAVLLLIPLARHALPSAGPAATLEPAAPRAADAVPMLVFGETLPDQSTTILYTAPADDTDARRELARFAHRSGDPPRGEVAPGGRLLALVVTPPEASERQARSDGNQLWLVDLAGGAARQAAGGVGYLAAWAPDGSALAYASQVALDEPLSPLIPFRTDVYTLGSQPGTEPHLVLSDAQSALARPLGWEAGGVRLLVVTAGDAGWSVSAYGPAGGLPAAVAAFPASAGVRNLSLAPDGSRLLVERAAAGQVELVLQPLDGKPGRRVAAAAAGNGSRPPFSGLWSPDGRRLLLDRQPASAGAKSIQALDAAGDEAGELALPAAPGGGALLPVCWSPDGAWLALLDLERMQSRAYLLRVAGGDLTPIRLEREENWINLYGWAAP